MDKTGLKPAERYSLGDNKVQKPRGFSEQEVVNFETHGNCAGRRSGQTNEIQIVQSAASRMR
ncbi:hypothetical protein GCM10008014_56560 [Paenibacillus silvae]|uniref:YpzG family protein n=1 Tax=Paenibacillus silvae TaxID=1325358 RepID=A0ABQ1ZMN5_9BACL|nr:hypothetical protein GCM10008014_56560 [Paenibacillus silvae]